MSKILLANKDKREYKGIMDCGKCEHYLNGQGDKNCLSCKKYLYFTIKSNKRNPVIFEHFPQEIWDNIANEPEEKRLIDLIRLLPLSRSVPLMMHYVLNISMSDIAIFQKKSRQQVYKNNKNTLMILREMLK